MVEWGWNSENLFPKLLCWLAFAWSCLWRHVGELGMWEKDGDLLIAVGLPCCLCQPYHMSRSIPGVDLCHRGCCCLQHLDSFGTPRTSLFGPTKEPIVVTSSGQQGREGRRAVATGMETSDRLASSPSALSESPIWSALSLRVRCLSNQCSVFHIKMWRVCELSCNSVTCCNSMWFWIWISVSQPYSFKGKKEKKQNKTFF